MKKQIILTALAAALAMPMAAEENASTASQKQEYLTVVDTIGSRVLTGKLEMNMEAIKMTQDSIEVTLKGMTAPQKFSRKAISKVEITDYPVASLMDIEWNPDGSASDHGKFNLPVTKIGLTEKISVSKDNPFSTYAPAFDNKYGQIAGGTGSTNVSGAYAVSYLGCKNDFDASMAKGFTMEAIIKLASHIDTANEKEGTATLPDAECKFFSNTQGGGAGFNIWKNQSDTILSRTIGFQTSVLKNSANQYINVKPGVKPKSDVIYHMTGTWDPTAGKLFFVLNGEKYETTFDVEDIKLPYNGVADNPSWFGIGADPTGTKNKGEASFPGTIYVSRIYDRALSEEEVQILYSKVKDIITKANEGK